MGNGRQLLPPLTDWDRFCFLTFILIVTAAVISLFRRRQPVDDSAMPPIVVVDAPSSVPDFTDLRNPRTEGQSFNFSSNSYCSMASGAGNPPRANSSRKPRFGKLRRPEAAAGGDDGAGEVRDRLHDWNPYRSDESSGAGVGWNGFNAARSSARTAPNDISVAFEKSLPDEMRKLGIGNGLNSDSFLKNGVGGNSVPTQAGYNEGFVFGSSNFAATRDMKAGKEHLHDELRRMNIGAGVYEDEPISSTVGSGVFVFGAKRFNDAASSSSVLNDSSDMFLRDKVRNLNLGSDVASDTVFNGSKGEGSSPKQAGGSGRFFFGAKQQGQASGVSFVEPASDQGNFLFDGMRKLNINGNLESSSNLNGDKLSQSAQERNSGGADFIFVAKKQYDSNGRMNFGTNVPEEFGEKSLHGRSKSRNAEIDSSRVTNSKSHTSVGANVERNGNNGGFVFESKGRKEKFARESVIKESLDKHLSDEMKKLNMGNSFNHSVEMDSNSTWQGVGHRTVTPKTLSGDSREFSHADKVPKEMPASKNLGSTNSSARVEKSFSSWVCKEKPGDDLHYDFVIDPASVPEIILESKKPSEGERFVFSGRSTRSKPFNVPVDKQQMSLPTPFIFQAEKLGVHKWPYVSGEDSSGKNETHYRSPSLNSSDTGVARNTCAVTSSDTVDLRPSPISDSVKVEPSISMPNQDQKTHQSSSEESLLFLKAGFENDGYSNFTFCSARDSGLNGTTRKKWGKSKVKSTAGQSKFSSREERSCSPMDFSPYQETLVDYQSTTETSRESAESDHHSTFGHDVNKVDRGMKDKDNNADIATIAGTGSCAEESSKPVNQPLVYDHLNLHNNGFGDTGSEQTHSTSEMQTNINVTSPLENSPRMGFKFSSSPSPQCALPSARDKYRRKFRTKSGYDVSSSFGLSIPQVHPVEHFSPLSTNDREDDFVSGDRRLAGNASHKSDSKVSVTHHEPLSATSICVAAQKTCESWRLRGNQAYSNGNFHEAEEFYTHGVNCLSPSETNKSCLQSLMKCYSNRALIRMSCGSIKEALEDCLMASSIDQNFAKVQIRAAKCYLDLGLIDDATKYFNNCLRSELDLNGTLFAEASDGLQKAEHASGYINRAEELLRSNTTNDMSKALEFITKGLSICPRSEHLFKMKAEALLKAQKYDYAVRLCERSLESAVKNHGYHQIVNGVDIFMDAHVKFWRWNLMAKSYFHLGRLETALDMLQMLEKGENNEEKHANSFSDSSASFVVTVRELLSHKAAGNKAFQAGKHLEAVEHYTAALACNVESRPFAAICFCNRAAAYQSLGQIPDAIADCSLAIALDPHYAKAISRRATLHEMIRDYGHASADLQRLLACLHEKSKENSARNQQAVNPVNDDLKQARARLSLIEAEARKDTPLNFYMILGIDQSSSSADIKKAYRKAALRHHPDKAAGQFLARLENCDERLWKEVSHEIIGDADRLFKMIGEANAVLSDLVKRLQYDEEEEIRSGSRRGDAYSGHSDLFERNSSQRHWQHSWRSYDNPRQRWSESKHSRYF